MRKARYNHDTAEFPHSKDAEENPGAPWPMLSINLIMILFPLVPAWLTARLPFSHVFPPRTPTWAHFERGLEASLRRPPPTNTQNL